MKYLDEDGLQVVADKINTRLKTVTEMPLTAKPGAVRLYVGEDMADYKKGHIYKYNSETYYCYIAEDGGYYYHFYIKEIEVGATVYACGSPEWFQKKADSISELTSDFSEIGYTFSITAASPSSITVSNGLSIVANRSSDDDLSNVGWTDITASGETADLNFNPASENAQSGIAASQALKQIVSENTELVWENKTWQGFNMLSGDNIWTDGTDVYFSNSSYQYKLNKSTSTWESKTWQGLSNFYGGNTWKDEYNIYCSRGSDQYVLNKSTSTWEPKTWQGLTSFNGSFIWKDGDNIYYSNSSDQYVLNKSTSTWVEKTWYGLTNIRGDYVWKDGNNIYYSNSSDQYVLNKSTSTWVEKTWYGLTEPNANNIWTDGVNMYYSRGSEQYVLNESTSTWEQQDWNKSFFGKDIWVDGDMIYCSGEDSGQLVFHRN